MNLRSLQENVTEATQAMDNVAEFIQKKTGDTSVFSTVRPINYGDILNRIDFSGSTSTFAQITVYKTQSKSPSTPVGGTVDLILGVVEAPEGWSFKPSGTKDIWASTAIWYDGTNQSEWSTPFMVTGIDGTPGEPGEQGAPGISYRTIQVYTTTDSMETIPDRPVGGYWNIKTNEVSVPVSNNVRWYLNANDERNPKKFTWIASNTFGENGDPISDWSLPLRITGEDGKDGADGRVIEFIYRLVPNYESFTQLRNFLNIKENNLPSINEPDYVPEVNDNLNINTVWTDSPTGISIDHQIEVVCSRIRKNVESPWEPWSQCAIWSKWGEDGMDGDGVEYIYLVTPAEINGVPTTSGHVRDTMVPGYDINDSRYQQDEFCFNDEWGFIGYDWTDEPRDVGPGEPMEWVMVRKFRDNKWQSFSEPALWATYSESGVSYITSFVFKRGSIDNPPTRPEGGDYTDPKPSDKTWSDTVPSENSNLPVWMSTRVFCSTSEYSDDDWSEPKMLADTPDFQVEYSADPNVTGDKITPYTGDEASWRASQPFVWGDDSEITDPIWMITSTRHGGKWSNWTLSRIKGEKGDKGDAGTSVNIQHKVKTKQELLNEWADYLAGGAFFTSTAGLIGGEGVYVEEEGLLYIYSGGYYPGEDTNFDLYWTAIHVKGEPGDSAYLYIRFTDGVDNTAVLYENTPKKYIGVKYSTEKITDPAILNAYDTYMWSLWKGEDGWGREQVFLLTHKDTLFDPDSKHLDLPSNNDKTVSEYYPTHSYGTSAYPIDKWSDTPLTPTADYPFCWVATRKGQGNSFEDWTGPDGKCALYSRYSYDGADSIRVDLSNDLAIIPMEDGKIDPDFKDEVKTTVRVFVGDEQIPESDFTVAGHGVSIVGDEVKLLLSELTVDTKEIPLTVSLKDSAYQTTINWHILQTDVAYELVPDTFSIRRYVIGEKAGYLEKDKLSVDIWKWSDNKWIASNTPVFAKVTFINGSVNILSTEDGSVEVAKNGHTSINLAGLKDVSEIKIYVVQANASGVYLSNGNILSFETITVVSDGEPGNDGVTTFKSTVFKRSNTPITTAPSGGDINSPYPNPLNGWSDGIPTGKEILWASTATFSTDPTLCKDWSTPAQMTDTADIEIIYSSRIFKNSAAALATIPAGFSKNGADNIDPNWLANAKNNGWSDDGNETSIWMATSKMHDNVWGSWNVSRIKGESAGRTVFVFTIAESDTTNVGRPTGGSLNISSNVVTGISPTNTAYTWSMNTPSKTETRKYIWQSNATFDGDGNLVGDWSEPICITGAAGRDGADGTNIEFIYRLLPDKESLATLKANLAQKALPNTQTGEVPKSGNDGISSKDWTDEPEGISEDFKVEVMCSRKAKMIDGKFSGWGEWSTPSYWSMWGEEGKDGPGLEYIFCISAQDANVSLMWEALKAYSNYAQYQDDDFYPKKYDATSDWTDEPSDVSKDKPYEYVSTRKKINDKWEAYSKPKLWAKYAEDGSSFVTSYIFKRYTPTTSKSVPDAPTGGEWNVAPSGWSDTIPSTGDGPVWMSYRMFKIGDTSYDQTWSTPIIMIDTNDFEVIYGTEKASMDAKIMPKPIEIKNAEGYAANGWYDEPQTGVDFYWMATATCDNGKWSNWTITKIKGEDGIPGPPGPKGDPGKSVSIKGNFPTEAALRTAWDEWGKGNASTSGFVGGNLTTGDGYLVQDTGDLWVFDGDGTAFNDAWVNVGKIQGEPGKSMYMAIRYSNNANGNPMLNEGEYGKYIGISVTDHELTAEEKNNYETYKPWQKWAGDDGWGWEQVFAATKTNVAPYINSSDANISESELITKYSLSDKPVDVNDSDRQYIWYWTRKTNGSWQGASERNNKIYAALYTRWAKDGVGIPGKGIASIEKLFAVNNSPTVWPTTGWDRIETAITSDNNRYLWCKETITYTDGTSTEIHYLSAIHGEPGATGTGNDAPLIYPAGIWDDEKTYQSTATRCPYVFYTGTEKYYVLKTSKTPPAGTIPTNTEYWDQMESFEAIYSDIGLFNQALVGSMVFYKQYVFSQQGVAKLTMLNYFAKGDAITYTDIIRLAEDNALLDLEKAFTMYFEPNFKLNAETGEVSLNKLSINVVNEDGSQGTSEIPFSSFAEDIWGEKIVKKEVDGKIKLIPTVSDYLGKGVIPADVVKDLIDTTIPTLISRAENITSEIEDVVDNSNSGGSSGVEVEYENTAQDIYGWDANSAYYGKTKDSLIDKTFNRTTASYSLRRPAGLSVTPHLNPLLTVLESAIDNDSLETALVYPIDLRGDDDQPFKSPVTNIELDPDENGTRPTIGWVKEQLGALKEFTTFISEVEKCIIGQRTTVTTGGMSYLKDVYNNASGYQTSIGTGSIETGAILAGTIAVTGEVTVNNTTGNAIVAGIHNGSKILKGSNGDGLMLFAGAKGIEQTTETFDDGGETKTITKVNNATTEIYSDGSAKFGNDISGIRIDAEGNVSMGFVDYDSFNAVTEFKHNDSVTVTPFKPNIHVVNMELGSKLANNVLNVNIDCPENQNGIMKMTVVNSSSYEICLKFSEEYYLAVGQKFIMPYNTVQEFIINQKTIYPVGGFDPYYKITANGTLFDAPGVKHMRNLYPTVVSGTMAYFPLLSMMNLTGECSLTTPANKHLYIKAHLLSNAIISYGSIDSIGDAEGVYTRTFSGALGCWNYGSLSKSDEAEDYYVNATVSFSHDGATGAGFTLAPNVRGWVD